MGDFNINLLNYDSDNSVSEYMDMVSSFSFLPYITAPTRLTPHSKTLIDNIFYNGLVDEAHSGNLITSLSEHLA